MLNNWRNEYHAEETKAEARLYGRYYLRVINLDSMDKLCDEVLFGIDTSVSSLTTHREANEPVKEAQEKSTQEDFDNEKKHAPLSSPRTAGGGVRKKPSISKSNNNQEVAKRNKEDKADEVKKTAPPKQERVAGAFVSTANALQLAPTPAHSTTPTSKDTTQPTHTRSEKCEKQKKKLRR
ncbi:hypothetical protein ANCCAN_06908 [Ancylostoma caninum]|uniref:Uncharacterized protein n=1 Tax=Ancylostoma caninum TaxID=29170 RepID=A0A368GVS6_ANCCA|nr:hypothetical protein ANCCAN_06908 [Ancylostoma caninum]